MKNTNSYCPSCFSDSLSIKASGVVYVAINKKKLDSGQFVFNTSRENEVDESLCQEIERFFKWYSNFQNKEPINEYQIESSDFTCSNGCSIPLNMRFSVVNELFTEARLMEVFNEMGKKYGMKIQLD